MYKCQLCILIRQNQAEILDFNLLNTLSDVIHYFPFKHILHAHHTHARIQTHSTLFRTIIITSGPSSCHFILYTRTDFRLPTQCRHTHKYTETHMEMRKINSKRREMTLKFMRVVKDQTRNLMKMLDARRLDLRVKRVSLVSCHWWWWLWWYDVEIDALLPELMKLIHSNSFHTLGIPIAFCFFVRALWQSKHV